MTTGLSGTRVYYCGIDIRQFSEDRVYAILVRFLEAAHEHMVLTFPYNWTVYDRYEYAVAQLTNFIYWDADVALRTATHRTLNPNIWEHQVNQWL